MRGHKASNCGDKGIYFFWKYHIFLTQKLIFNTKTLYNTEYKNLIRSYTQHQLPERF